MARVRRRDTSAEVRLRRGLWAAGVRGWRCDVAALPGRPDLVFRRRKVAVFVDGLLWHGHPSRYPANLTRDWQEKIAKNIDRDLKANAALEAAGWTVLRFWDIDIQRGLARVVEDLCGALSETCPVGVATKSCG